MNLLSHNMPESHQIDCPSCGSNNLSSETINEPFQYGDKAYAVTLSASIPIYHCTSCGFSFTTDEASDIKHDVVCHHLGVLTPTNIRGIRDQYGLSQIEFSILSKIGKASLARWETGVLIQNQANDNFLYLLSFSDNVLRLKERALLQKVCSSELTPNVIPFPRKLRTIPDEEITRLQAKAERFELFPTSTAI